jgi:hypothetical protein
MLGVETPWWPEIRRECPPVFSGTAPDGHALTHTERTEQLETCAIDVLSDDPIHPVLESVAPQSGFGGGLSGGWDFSHGADQNALSARALLSENLFWLVAAQYTIAPRLRHRGPGRTADRPRFDVYTKIWDLPRLSYYGLGPTAPHLAMPYSMREFLAGADGSFPVTDWLRVGARAEIHRPSIGDGSLPLTTPGLASQPWFMRYSALAQFHTPSLPPYAATATLDYSVYQDLGGSSFSFGRFAATLEWTRPLTHSVRADPDASSSFVDRLFCRSAKVTLCDFGTITVRGRVTLSNTFAHSVIPFYYQPTLGGTDINGFDTLRGFDDYRFRAPDDWLTQVEYTHGLWGPIGLLLFYDVGKVALGTSQLNFATLRQDFGAGATLTVVSRIVLRAYIAFGSGEGTASAVKLAQF